MYASRIGTNLFCIDGVSNEISAIKLDPVFGSVANGLVFSLVGTVAISREYNLSLIGCVELPLNMTKDRGEYVLP